MKIFYIKDKEKMNKFEQWFKKVSSSIRHLDPNYKMEI